jgi:hypothetical protein
LRPKPVSLCSSMHWFVIPLGLLVCSTVPFTGASASAHEGMKSALPGSQPGSQPGAQAGAELGKVGKKSVLSDALCPNRPSLAEISTAALNGQQDSDGAPSDREFYLSALLAALAYEPSISESQLRDAGYSEYVAIENKASGFSGFLVAAGERAFLAIAGTVDIRDVVADLRFVPVPESSSRVAGRVHSGFQAQVDSVWPLVSEQLSSPAYRNRSLTVVGHSLGAGLATLFAARLQAFGFAIDRVIALASPRVGDSEFSGWYENPVGANLGERTFRYSKGMDIVPRVPPDFRDAEAFAAVFPDQDVPELSKLVSSFRYEHVARTAHIETLTQRATEVPRLPSGSGDQIYWQDLQDQIASGQPIWTVVSGVTLVLDHLIDQFVCYGSDMLESSTVR